ncbi:MAG: DUF1996 domain-containing protein [Solirubrobacteraceae bacterium]
MPRLRLLAVLTILGSLATVVSLAAARDRPAPTRGQFATPCGFSHRAADDPIVKPGQPGAAHSHDFFGNTSTNAASSLRSLRAAGTTCRRGTDRAAYWVPTLYRDGVAVTPKRAQIYYRTGRRARTSIRPFPAGLRVVAGNAKAAGPQDLRVAAWGCTGVEPMSQRAEVPLCPTGSNLKLRVRFPDCWNGRTLDSADHASHLAYSRRGACPASHPVAVPALAFNVIYPFRGGSGVTLASGSRYSGHADFFNAWDQRALAGLVRRCLNAGRHCRAPRRVARRRG